jgi:hypothetical protein
MERRDEKRKSYRKSPLDINRYPQRYRSRSGARGRGRGAEGGAPSGVGVVVDDLKDATSRW